MQKFRTDRTGGIAVMFALCAPAILGVLALATDFVMINQIDSKLQAAADSAALASAKELSLSGSSDAHIATVARELALANLTGDTKVQKSSDESAAEFSVDVEISRKTGMVSVSIDENWTPLFLNFLSPGSTPVHVVSRARSLDSGLTCVIGLDPDSPSGIKLLKSASLTAAGCVVYSNAKASKGIELDDKATLQAQLICSAGGFRSKGSNIVQPAPTTDCPVLEDPLAGRPPPAVGGCDHNNLAIKDDTITLQPGVYCSGLTLSGTAKVTLNPGIYVISDGKLKISGTALLGGEFVGFYLTGNSTRIDFDPDSTIDLTAPKDGPLAGLLFFEDRNSTGNNVHRIGSNNARRLIGTIYLPNGKLRIDANAPVADNSAYTALVVRSLELDEGPNLVLHSDYNSTEVPVPKGLITSRVVLSQ